MTTQVRKVDERVREDLLASVSALLICGESVRHLGYANAMSLSLELTKKLRSAHSELSVMGLEIARRVNAAHAQHSAMFAAVKEGIARGHALRNPFVDFIERVAENENDYRQRMRKMADEI